MSTQTGSISFEATGGFNSYAKQNYATLSQIKGQFAVSDTGAAVADKIATIVPDDTKWKIYEGATVTVKFSSNNTAVAPTLNVNNTGAKEIRDYNGNELTEAAYKWLDGAAMALTYDGTYWRIQDSKLMERIYSAETSIEQNAQDISLRATKEEVNTAIDDVKITKSICGKTITTEDAADLPLLSLDSVHGESVQDGTPTPDAPIRIQAVRCLAQNKFDSEWLGAKVSSFGFLGEDKWRTTASVVDFSKNFCMMVKFVRSSSYPTQRYCLCSSYNIKNPDTNLVYPEIGIELASGSGNVRVYSISDDNVITDKSLGKAPAFDVWSTVAIWWNTKSKQFTWMLLSGDNLYSGTYSPTGTYSGVSGPLVIGADSRKNNTWNCKYLQLDTTPVWYEEDGYPVLSDFHVDEFYLPIVCSNGKVSYINMADPTTGEAIELHGLDSTYSDLLKVDASGHVELHKRTISKTYTGGFLYYGNYNSHKLHYINTGYWLVPNGEGPAPMANMYESAKSDSAEFDHMIRTQIATRTKRFYVYDDSYANATDFNAFIAENPLHVVLPLAESDWYTIDLGYVDLPQVANGSTIHAIAEVQPQICGSWWTKSGQEAGTAHQSSVKQNAELRITSDGISSEVSKMSSIKYVNTGYSYTLGQIKTFSTEGYSGTWTIASDSSIRVGDTVYYKVVDTTRSCPVYIKATVTKVNSDTSITSTSHGYEDTLPVETIKSTINQSADSIKIEARHVDIEGAAIFNGGAYDMATTVVKTETQWYSSSSSIMKADGAWTTSQPNVNTGRYIWQRTLVTYADGSTGYDPSEEGVCIQGQTDLSNYSTTTQMNTAIGNAVDDIEIGGRNLLLGTATPKTSNLAAVPANNYKTWDSYNQVDKYANFGLSVGDYVTLSFDWSVTGVPSDGTVTAAFGTNAGPWEYFGKIITFTPGESSGHVEKSFKVTSALASSQGVKLRMRLDSTVALTANQTPITISNAKLEKGNRATDWTPAPEDINADIKTLQDTAALKANAVARTQRIYFRTNTMLTNTITGPTSWISEAGNKFNTVAPSATITGWSTKVTPLSSDANNTTKYLYLYTCIQTQTVEQVENGGTVCTSSNILLDDTTTVINGGNIITGTVTANKLNATDINASNVLTVGAFSNSTQQDILNSNMEIGGRNLLLGTSGEWSDWITPQPNTSNITNYLYMTKNDELLRWASADQFVSFSMEIEFSGVTKSNSGTFKVYSQDCFKSIQNGQLNGSSNTDWNVGAAARTMDLSEPPNDGVLLFKKTTKYTSSHTSRYALLFSIRADYWGSGKYRVRNVKYELGNIATAWTPAPEDIESTYSTKEEMDTAIKSVAQNWFATCPTPAATAAKIATITPATADFSLKSGVTVNVKFTNTNSFSATATTPITLNINNTGAKNIYYGGSANPTGTNTTAFGRASYTNTYVYDGTYWVWVSSSADNNDTYNQGVNQFYNTIKAKTAIKAESIIVGNASGYSTVAAGISFDLSYPILWCTKALAINDTNYGNLFTTHYDRNLATNHSFSGGVADSVVYLVGAVTGNTFTLATTYLTTTLSTTQTDPVTVYIPIGKLGTQSNGLNYFYFISTDRPTLYAYIDGKFRQVTPSEILVTHRIYYRTATAKSNLAAPTAWVNTSGDVYDNWTTKVTPEAANTEAGTTRYPYLYTCEQRKRLDGTIECTEVLIDDTVTVLHGGNIIAGTLHANAVDAKSGTFNVANIPDLNASKITAGNIATDRIKANVVNAINATVNKIDAKNINASEINIGSLSGINAYSTSNEIANTYATKTAFTNSQSTLRTGGLGIHVNATGITGTNNGECYFHGFDESFNPANVDGWVMWNGSQLTIPKGYWINPNKVLPYNITTYTVFRTSNSSFYGVYYDSTNEKWRASQYNASQEPGALTDFSWVDSTDVILAAYIEPASEAAITSISFFNPPKHYSELADVMAQTAANKAQFDIDNLSIGGRNLLRATPKASTPQAYEAARLNLSENLVKGEVYTLQLWGTCSRSDKEAAFVAYWGGGRVALTNPTSQLGGMNRNEDGSYWWKTFTVPDSTHSDTNNAWLNIYNGPTPVGATGTTYNTNLVKWKLEKGNRATDWTPAPEDTSEGISAAQDAADKAQATADTAGNPNLSPFFDKKWGDYSYWHTLGSGSKSWSNTEGLHSYSDGEDGWAHFTLDARTSAGNDGSRSCYFNIFVKKGCLKVEPGKEYTWLIEIKNATITGGVLRSRISTGDTTKDKLSDMGTGNVLTTDGIIRTKVTAKADFSSLTQDTRGYFYVATGVYAEFDARISIYEGDYEGLYKPYVDPDARKVADNFIHMGNDGIRIASTSPGTQNQRIELTNSNTSFYDSAGKKRTQIDTNGLHTYNASGNETGLFGQDTARLGRTDNAAFHMNANSLEAYYMDNGTRKLYFQVSPNGLKYGPNLNSIVATTTDLPTKLTELQNDAQFQTALEVSNTVETETNRLKAVYGTCSTAAGTAAKAVVCDNFYAYIGARITVKFSTANTTDAPTLKIQNSSGTQLLAAKSIFNANAVASSTNPVVWGANTFITFVWDGTNWNVEEKPTAYAIPCSTGATTQTKAGTLADTLILNGTMVVLKCSTANTYTANVLQLNISDTGAKQIYVDNIATSSTNTLTWQANTDLLFVRNGARWDLAGRSDADKIASNYMDFDATYGLKIASTNPKTATRRVQIANDSINLYNDNANYLAIKSTGMELFKDSQSIALFGSNAIRIGKTDNRYIALDNNGINLYNDNANYLTVKSTGMELFEDSKSIALFGSDIRIGKADNIHIALDYHSLQLIDKDGMTYFHVSDLRDETGYATVTERFIGTGTGTKCITNFYISSIQQVTVNNAAVSIKEISDYSFTLNSAPANGAIILATYSTTSPVTGFTFGSRENNSAIGAYSFSAGYNTVASGMYSFVEGENTIARGPCSHAEGHNTIAHGDSSHAEGLDTIANSNYSHAEGSGTKAIGLYSHAEGWVTTADRYASHAEGYNTVANNNYSHAEGCDTIAKGLYSHAEGWNTMATNDPSHAEGENTIARGPCSHAEGHNTIAHSNSSHAEGYNTTANGGCSHAEGNNTLANGSYSHAEGYSTIANNWYSHAEGNNTLANGLGSHAEGGGTVAKGIYSHAGGSNTIADQAYMTAIGQCNRTGVSGVYFAIGNGSSNSNRKNAFTVLSNGSAYINGTTSANGTAVTSDVRVKDQIKVLDKNEAVNLIKQLKPSSYLKQGKKELGFIAQEIENLDKYGDYLVNKDNSGLFDYNDFRLLDYQGLIAPTVSALQAALERIEKLEKEISILKKE